MSRSTRCKNAGAVVASAKVKEGAEAARFTEGEGRQVLASRPNPRSPLRS